MNIKNPPNKQAKKTVKKPKTGQLFDKNMIRKKLSNIYQDSTYFFRTIKRHTPNTTRNKHATQNTPDQSQTFRSKIDGRNTKKGKKTNDDHNKRRTTKAVKSRHKTSIRIFGAETKQQCNTWKSEYLSGKQIQDRNAGHGKQKVTAKYSAGHRR